MELLIIFCGRSKTLVPERSVDRHFFNNRTIIFKKEMTLNQSMTWQLKNIFRQASTVVML